MHPFSSRFFQRNQEHNLNHPSLVDIISTKKNKLPTFLYVWSNYRQESMCEMPLVEIFHTYQLLLKLSNLIMFIVSMPYHTKQTLSFFHLFFQFCDLVKLVSSKRKFSQIWLQTIYERKIFIPSLELRPILKTMTLVELCKVGVEMFDFTIDNMKIKI